MPPGGTAFVGGLSGMITLVLGDAALDENLWSEWLFVALFAASALCMLVGLYSIAGAYLPLPMPQTRDERHAAPIEQGLTDAQLSRECASLGDAIANFAAVRLMQAPMLYDEQFGSRSGGLPAERRGEQHRVALANHERESMDQYGDDLGRRVRAVVPELRRRGLTGDKEGDDRADSIGPRNA